MMKDKIKYLIALSQIKGVGFRRAHQIIEEYGSAQAFIETCLSHPRKTPSALRENCSRSKINEALEYAEVQIEYCHKYQVRILDREDEAFPERLRRYPDSPLILYAKGDMDLNAPKILAMVGTRKMTAYGKWMIEETIAGLRGRGVLVVSGLAYGVDTQVHRSCVEHGISTVGVMGTGIDQIYPSSNRQLARKMLGDGGVITEYGIRTKPEAYNFPARNRIIAALADGLIVVESKDRGGAMITADLAFGYDKEVFAFPGRARDTYSRGTNLLIKSHRAQLIESAEDLLALMGWETGSEDVRGSYQASLFQELTENEKSLIEVFSGHPVFHIDEALTRLPFSNTETAALLLQLELKGIIRALPGSKYRILL